MEEDVAVRTVADEGMCLLSFEPYALHFTQVPAILPQREYGHRLERNP